MIEADPPTSSSGGRVHPAEAERSLRLMGTRVRVLVGAPARANLPDPGDAADRVIAFLEDYDRRLSRFRPDSELSALNADPRTIAPASPLLRSAIGAALATAHSTGGLVDPTLLADLERAGYRESWDVARRIPLRTALAAVTTPRRPAAPRAPAAWRQVVIDDDAGTIGRPASLRIDTGGSGKGHAADLATAMLEGYETWAVDCGGDVRIGGTAGAERAVEVESPFGGEEPLAVLGVRDGAVATSGMRSRIWAGSDGHPGHHLLDPSTGEPAFTGLVSATAFAPTAVRAEGLAKAAVLSGPLGAHRVLARHGGLTVDERGLVDRIAPRPVIRLRATADGLSA